MGPYPWSFKSVVKYVGAYRWSSKSVLNYMGPYISGKMSSPKREAPQYYVLIKSGQFSGPGWGGPQETLSEEFGNRDWTPKKHTHLAFLLVYGS